MSASFAMMGAMRTDSLPELGRFAGIITAAELAQAGLGDAAIRTMLRQGALTRVDRGVYARTVPTGRDGRALQIAAALAISGPDAVASHYDAALVHGLDLVNRPPPAIAITRPRTADGSRTGRKGIHLYPAALPAGHVTVVNRIPVTTVARTVADLARTTPLRSGVVTADSALHARKTTKDGLRAVIATMNRWPGIETARLVTDFADARAESPFESLARLAFRDWGLPPPVLQAEVGHDYVIGRVDFLWPAHATIAEADGAAKYADPRRARLQLERDARLRHAGFEVVHFTWYDLHTNPHVVRQWILDAFRRQAILRAGIR